MTMDFTHLAQSFFVQNLHSLWTIGILTALGAAIIGSIAFFSYRGSRQRNPQSGISGAVPTPQISTQRMMQEGGKLAHNLGTDEKGATPSHETAPESTGARPSDHREADTLSNHRMPPPGGRVMEYLSLKGFFNVGFLSVLFLRGITFLRQNLPPVDDAGLGESSRPLYQLPWYLMIGAADSGKTSMLKGSTLKNPVGQPTFGGGDDPALRWWFFNRGIVLDIRGNFFINRKDARSDEKNWHNILGLLSRYRAKRPIDGIVLTLSAEEFLGDHALLRDQLVDRARAMAQKLHAMQHNLGLRLPLYIILTKGDLIPGFTDFCKEIPEHHKTSMLGWSNPYHASHAFQSEWVDEAFNHMDHTLTTLQHEIFATGHSDDNRDGVFIFPRQLQRLKRGVETYINHILKDSSYREDLLLRGIYVTGREDAVPPPISDADTPNPTSNTHPHPHHVCFVDDIFSQKIFMETGLAHPITHRVARANRNLRIAEVSTALLVCVGTIGVLQTYTRFKKQNNELLPVLGKMNSVLGQLRHVRGADSARSVALFDDYTNQLINMMHTLSESDFKSIFIPPSWFSPLKDNLNQSLKVSYHHIILRTIYIDLLLKGRELLYMRPTPMDQSTRLNQVINPLKSVEFDFLVTFVDRLSELHRMILTFNRLDESHTADPLKELVRYTFKSDVPPAFEAEFQHFYKILKDSPFPKINLTSYTQDIQKTLHILYSNFLNNVMNERAPTSILGQIESVMAVYEQPFTGIVPSDDGLRAFAADLNEAVPILLSSRTPWMDAKYLDLGAEFDDMMEAIQKSPLLGGAPMVQSLALESARVFAQFKQDMIRMIPSVRDAMLSYSGGALSSPDDTWMPSTLLKQLQKAFSMLFQQPFMQKPIPKPLVTVIPLNQVVYWDPKLVDAAEAMLNQYELFRRDILPLIPPAMRDLIDRSAQHNVQDNILSTLARAQNIVSEQRSEATAKMLGYSTPSGDFGLSSSYSTNVMRYETARDEEILRSKIANFRQTAPKFLNILRALGASSAGESFVGLRNLLSSLAVQLLEHVERVSMAGQPYALRGGNFSWWDGNEGSILNAFYVKDESDLNAYLTLQRERLKLWSLNYAEPIVTFLGSDVMLDAPFARGLLDRWSRIVDQMVKFEQRRPDTTVQTLETDLFLLNHVNRDNCMITIPMASIRGRSGDFFQDVNTFIRRELRSQCEVLLRQRSIQNYQALAAFFNENLKDKFPFVSNIVNSNIGEAEPTDLKKFFDMYQQFGGSPEAILAQIADMNVPNNDALEFLKGMERVKAFFKPYLESDNYEALPEFDVTVDFRVNREGEQNANYIVDWLFENGDAASLSNHMKDRMTRWTFGEACEFSFRWPDNAGIGPTLDEGDTFMTVEEKTAFFGMKSRWSLLWMIRQYGLNRPTQNEPSPYILKFTVPLGPTKRAVIFNRISIRALSPGKEPGKVMDIPTFPTQAPALSEDILNAANQPVLTKAQDVVTPQIQQAQPFVPPPRPAPETAAATPPAPAPVVTPTPGPTPAPTPAPATPPAPVTPAPATAPANSSSAKVPLTPALASTPSSEPKTPQKVEQPSQIP